MKHLIRRDIVALSQATEYAKEISALSVAERYGLPVEQIVDLSLNINVFGPPPGAVRAVQERLEQLYQYPDVALGHLRAVLAQRHAVTPDMILPGDGLDEVLKLIAQTFVDPGDEAIIPIPTFPRYELEVRIMGGRPHLVPLTPDFQVPAGAVLAHVSERTKLIFICTPNNPTGVPVPRETILQLLGLGPDGPLVVVDEAIIFPDNSGMMDLLPAHPNLMVLRTLSKFYGLAGARVGYAVAGRELVAAMEIVRPPFNVNLLGEAAALGALADAGFLQRARTALETERAALLEALASLPGVRAVPSETSLLLIDVGGSGRTSAQVTEALAGRGVIVVDCRSYAGLEQADYIRISIGAPAANRRFVAALQAVLAGL